MKKRLIYAAAAGAAFALAGINNKLGLTHYTVETDKISSTVRMAFLSDIHSQRYKDSGKKLFSVIDKAKPECILLGGDIFDKYASDYELETTYELLRNLVLRYGECYFVTGNHEFESGRFETIKSNLKNIGVKVVGDKIYEFTSHSGERILIGGTDIGALGEDVVSAQKERFAHEAEKSGLFSILLRHVPMSSDGDSSFDLILSGHNHGGLWRLPGTDFGAAGGGKKLFPKYVHGQYDSHGAVMLVGSGITTQTYLLPRLYNPPEVIGLTLKPRQKINLTEVDYEQ